LHKSPSQYIICVIKVTRKTALEITTCYYTSYSLNLLNAKC
jgi:hypothetical protein